MNHFGSRHFLWLFYPGREDKQSQEKRNHNFFLDISRSFRVKQNTMAISKSIKRGAQELNISEDNIRTVLNWFFQKELPYVLFEEGEAIHFRNCGTFKLSHQKAIRGRNFMTKESITKGPRYRIVFNARGKYRRDVNGDNEDQSSEIETNGISSDVPSSA